VLNNLALQWTLRGKNSILNITGQNFSHQHKNIIFYTAVTMA